MVAAEALILAREEAGLGVVVAAAAREEVGMVAGMMVQEV